MHFIQLIITFAPLFLQLIERLQAGTDRFSPEEAEELGRELGRQFGQDVSLRIKGHEIIRGPACELIGGGLGRVALQYLIAVGETK